jgi:hypothetical protein
MPRRWLNIFKALHCYAEHCERLQPTPSNHTVACNFRFQAAWKSLAFRKAASQRWEKLRQDKLTDEWVLDILTTAKTEIRASAGRTHARWSQLVFEKSSGTPLSQWDYFVADMGGWIIKRLTWMDEEFNALT